MARLARVDVFASDEVAMPLCPITFIWFFGQGLKRNIVKHFSQRNDRGKLL